MELTDEDCTITDYFEMVSSMLVRGVDHLQCHHVDHHVSWSKLMGLVGWLVWLVKTNCWVSPERRFLTSPTHPPPLYQCWGQSHKSRPELFHPFYNHSSTLPLASSFLLLRFQDFSTSQKVLLSSLTTLDGRFWW